MKRIFGAVLLLMVASTPAWAQKDDPIQAGSVVLSGGSAVSFERLTFAGTGTGNGNTNSSANFITSQAAMTFYRSEKFGVGPIFALMHFSFPAGSGNNAGTGVTISGGGFTLFTFGAQAKFRIPLNPRTDFFVQGEGGYGKLATANGYYVGGGAGAEHFLSDRVAINFTAQYSHESIGGQGISGLAVAAGMSVVIKH